jgi:enoyl-CoA hydratase
MSDATEPALLTEDRDGVLLITLNRPAVRNAVNLEMAEAMAAALDRLDSSPELRVGVIVGAGPAFSSGMDLKAFAESGARPWAGGRGFAGIVERPATKPLVAGVEGFAVAGGLEIALACDLLVAASDSRFGLPEVKRGLVAAGGGLLRLPARLPAAVASELALTGDLIDAPRAYELGLANRLCPPGEALPQALALADQVAANAPLALTATKRILTSGRNLAPNQFWPWQRDIIDPVFASEDAAEGALAFTENRRPVWRGR